MMSLDLVGNMKAKKSLGQNFLINDTIIDEIVSLFCVTEKDLIIEIGPGRGALTNKLVNLPAKLVCIEIDRDMKTILSKYESDKCTIIYDDILSIDIKSLLSKFKYENLYVIGNLPYYITSPILERLIETNISAKEMIFMVQKEVADRFCAIPGHKEFGYMSLFLDFYYDVKSCIFVPKKDFSPVPKVDSEVIKLSRKDNNIIINADKYFAFLKQAFKMKRKTLKNNLSMYDWEKINSVLKLYQLSESIRAEEISQEIFIQIFNSL